MSASVLELVAQAAAELKRAQANGGDVEAARSNLAQIGQQAIQSGVSFGAIAHAQDQGERSLKDEAEQETARAVQRSAKQLAEAEAAHKQALSKAITLGYSYRQVGEWAGRSQMQVRTLLGVTRRQHSEAQEPAVEASGAAPESDPAAA